MTTETPPPVAAITTEQSHVVLGLMTMLITRRRQLVHFEKSAEKYLRMIGAIDREDSRWRVLDAVQEASWNEGDDIEEVTEKLLESLGLEVADQ